MWYQKPAGAANDLMQWVNFETGEWENVPAGLNDGDNRTAFKAVTLLMSSAIIGKGGSDTGELLVAYPMSSVHTVETVCFFLAFALPPLGLLTLCAFRSRPST